MPTSERETRPRADVDVRHVAVSYGPKPALTDITFEVPGGESLLVVGGNGAGKTTLLKAMVGHLPLRDGSVHIGGRAVAEGAWRTFREGISLVPQQEAIFAEASVAENLEIAGWMLDPSARDDRLGLCFRTFPRLAERSSQDAGSLSGGERQMLAVSMGLLAPELRVLLLDEPSAGLAPVAVQALLEGLSVVVAELDVTLVVAEQNVAPFLPRLPRVAILRLGELVHLHEGPDPLSPEAVWEQF